MPITAVHSLLKPDEAPSAPPLVVLFGEDVYLRAEAFKLFRDRLLPGEDAEFSLVEYEGSGEIRFADVMREVATPPMFGGDLRLVRIADADSFVSNHRDSLTDYLEKPSSAGILLLQVRAFPGNTNLYKASEKKGLLIDANPPGMAELKDWLSYRAKHHGVKCGRRALDLMIELVGSEAGLLDSEMARLALLLPPGSELTEDFVKENAGSWRLRKAWDMLDDAMAGNFAGAMNQLNLLLAAGEQPIGILAQIGFTLRKYAAATHLYLDAERSERRISPETAVREAKFFIPQYPNKPSPADLMKRLGRRRGLKLAEMLLQADLDLKGGQRIEPRIILEELLATLSSMKLR